MGNKLTYIWLLLPLLAILYFFRNFFLNGLLPIPSDALVGLYHPFRDLFAESFPNGIPFRNFLITDPVRQIIPWKDLTIDIFQGFQVPTWNPYEMAGKPLLANFQSGVFYPLNLILFIQPFSVAWSLFVLIQQVIAAVFMYMYLKGLKITRFAASLGTIAFVFSGFFIAWLEWGTVIHTVLWLPLILLSADKITAFPKKYRNKNNLLWKGIFIFSMTFSFFAGHLQTFFYVFLIVLSYVLGKAIIYKRITKTIFVFLPLFLILGGLTFFQLFPTLQFIMLSGRSGDLQWQAEGWFIPLRQLIMFIAPDFFGNPATLNYWGAWNYAEFIGYIGIIPLVFAIFSLFRKEKKVFFFLSLFLLSILFAVKNPLSELPFSLSVPLISSAQPTRLVGPAVFALSVLSALGLDYFYRFSRDKKMSIKKISIPIFVFGTLFSLLWLIVLFVPQTIEGLEESVQVAKRNLILPTVVFVILSVGVLSASFFRIKVVKIVVFIFILVTIFDLTRFAGKFTPFTPGDYFYPSTRVIEYLKSDKSLYRVVSLDDRILPPNVLTYYRIQTAEGYDPLYLKTYGGYIHSLETGRPEVGGSHSFNRILAPDNYNSQLFDLLNIKYVFSLNDIDEEKFKLVYSEGQTKVYENRDVFDRAFFVNDVEIAESEEEAMNMIFEKDLKESAVVLMDGNNALEGASFSPGTVLIEKYSDSEIALRTNNEKEGFLVLTDSYYPTWKAYVDGEQTPIFLTNYTFRGVVVPGGDHEVVFRNSLF